MKNTPRGQSEDELRLRRAVDEDPARFGIVGWYKRGLGGDRMKELVAEIENRENDRIKNNPKIGKEEARMAVPWTPERRARYKNTIEIKRAARSKEGAALDPEMQRRREIKNKRDREGQANKRKAMAGNGLLLPSDDLRHLPKGNPPYLTIHCMRCGFLMQIEEPGQFLAKK